MQQLFVLILIVVVVLAVLALVAWVVTKSFKERFDSMENRFADLAARKLSENQQALAGANTQNVQALFAGLKSHLDTYKEAVESARSQAQESAVSMTENVRSLQAFATQAQRFTAALLGGNKIQGNQGEQILANLLEMSGFRKGEQYDTQIGTQADGGRPDVCLYDALNKRVLFVDAKMNIKDYIDAYNLPEDTPAHCKAKKAALHNHATSVRQQINNLSEKDYAKTVASPRDGFEILPLVAMFCPFNAVLDAALEEDPALMQHAFEKNIVLVTPTTLWGYLWLLSYGWKRADAERNIEEIQRLGGDVLACVDALFRDIETVSKQFTEASEAFNSIRKRLGEKGQTSILRAARALRDYGAVPKKALKSHSLTAADDDEA